VRRAVKLVVAAITVAGVLFLFGFPVRTWFQQRQQMSVDHRRAAELAAENAKLAGRVAQLHTKSEIEEIARSQYGLVMPGEHAYVILPAASKSAASKPSGP
jgi:cell division protein FtsB